MNQRDLIESILAAEHQAQALTEDAKAQSSNIDESIQAEIQSMRARQEKSADEYLGRLEASEIKKREQRMQELDKRLEEKLRQVESIYAARRDLWVDAIFDRIIGRAE